MSRNILARYQQDRWEYHMLGLCVIDNHLNDEIEMASAHRSIVLNHLVEQTNRVKDLWLEFQRKSDNGHVVEDTAVQMAIEQHGLQSNNFYQPPSRVKKVSMLLFHRILYSTFFFFFFIFIYIKFVLILGYFKT